MAKRAIAVHRGIGTARVGNDLRRAGRVVGHISLCLTAEVDALSFVGRPLAGCGEIAGGRAPIADWAVAGSVTAVATVATKTVRTITARTVTILVAGYSVREVREADAVAMGDGIARSVVSARRWAAWGGLRDGAVTEQGLVESAGKGLDICVACGVVCLVLRRALIVVAGCDHSVSLAGA